MSLLNRIPNSRIHLAMSSILALPEDVVEFIFSFILLIPPTMARHPLQRKLILTMNIDRLEAMTKELNKNHKQYDFGKFPEKKAIDIACSTIFTLELVCKTWQACIQLSPTILSSAWIYIQYYERAVPLDTVEKVIQRKSNSMLREEIAEFAANRSMLHRVGQLFSNMSKLIQEKTTEEEAKELEKHCIRIAKIPELRKSLITTKYLYLPDWRQSFAVVASNAFKKAAVTRILLQVTLSSGLDQEFVDTIVSAAVHAHDLDLFKSIVDIIREHAGCAPNGTSKGKQNNVNNIILGENERFLAYVISRAHLSFLKCIEEVIGPTVMKRIMNTKGKRLVKGAVDNIAFGVSFDNEWAKSIDSYLLLFDHILEKYSKNVFCSFEAISNLQPGLDIDPFVQLCISLEKYGLVLANTKFLSDFDYFTVPVERIHRVVAVWTKYPSKLPELLRDSNFAQRLLTTYPGTKALEILNMIVEAGVDKKLLLGEFAAFCLSESKPQPPGMQIFETWVKEKQWSLKELAEGRIIYN